MPQRSLPPRPELTESESEHDPARAREPSPTPGACVPAQRSTETRSGAASSRGRHRRSRRTAPSASGTAATAAAAAAAADTTPDPGAGTRADDTAANASGAAGRHRRATARGGRPARRGSVARALPAGLTVVSLVSAAVGVFGLPAQGAPTLDAATAVGQDAAQAAAEARGDRLSRSADRLAVAEREAYAAQLLDRRIAATEKEMAAEAAARAQAAAKARAEARAKAIAAAKEAARPKWVLPVTSYHLTASFGESSGLWASSHTGQDFAAPTGTPVHSVGDGVIISAGWDGAYGRKIAVRHVDGTVTWYCHLSAFVRTSGRVKAGDVIGRVGSTGNTTGPHLHLEVRPGGGAPINPVPWLRAHGVQV